MAVTTTSTTGDEDAPIVRVRCYYDGCGYVATARSEPVLAVALVTHIAYAHGATVGRVS